jgi:hypothetical protein
MNQDERDELLIRMDENIKGVKGSINDHERRLRFLERLAYGLSGAWAFITAWLGIHVSKH